MVLVAGDGMPLLPCPDCTLFLLAVVPGDEPREKMDLVTYFGKRPPGVLHCTTKFCDYGKAPGAEDYAQQDVSLPQGHMGEVGGCGRRGCGIFWRWVLARQGPKPDGSSRKMASLPPSSPVPRQSCIDLSRRF